MSRATFDKVVACYELESELELRFPGPGETACDPPPQMVAVNLKMLKYGVRLPFSSFTREVLVDLHVAPTQLNPNAFDIFLALEKLWKQLGWV